MLITLYVCFYASGACRALALQQPAPGPRGACMRQAPSAALTWERAHPGWAARAWACSPLPARPAIEARNAANSET